MFFTPKLDLDPQYSGDRSKRFWKIINSLPEAEKQEMYMAGVLLQNMEELILKILNEYITELPKH